MSKQYTRPVIDTILLLLLGFALIQPLFKVEYLDNWGSIDSVFIGDARIIRENLPHPAWQPLWYGGTRFDYVYPPALRYGTALLSLATGKSTARAYHLYTASLYVLGLAGVYWLAFAGSRSRAQAWLAALGVALVSPSLLLMRELHLDSPDWVPQRLHVLAQYGEGPHISALSVLGFALAMCFVALRRRRPVTFVLSGFLCAAVVSNNFYGATALAIFFPLMTWSVWLDVRRRDVWLRAVGIAAMAYGLCAFWLTPSYLTITQGNLRLVAPTPTPGSKVIAALCVAAFCAITYRIAQKRRNVAWPVFLCGSALFLAIYVLSLSYFHFTITGNALRLAPELDLAIMLVVAYAVTHALRKQWPFRVAAVLALAACCYPAIHYVRRAWTICPRSELQAVWARPEFQIAKWMNVHLPGARAMTTGTIRFWYNTWFNNCEIWGGADQGLLNQNLAAANWMITNTDKPEVAIAWLQALGVDALVVPDDTSQEVYHDFKHPHLFQGTLPEIYNDHKGDVIYQLPRRFPGLARVVDRQTLAAMPVPRADDLAAMQRYVAAVEHGPDSRASVRWAGFEAADIAASVGSGQAVLLQETFDPAWHAYVNGKPVPAKPDPLGFMLIEAPAGTENIHLQFETPFENRFGWVLLALTLAAASAILVWGRKAAVVDSAAVNKSVVL